MRFPQMTAFKRLLAIFLLLPLPAMAEDLTLDRFEMQAQDRWRFFSDTVMGGVSSGQVTFRTDTGESYARMTGTVSTANNGGFIQMRMELPEGAPDGVTGVRLVVRGNDQRYFVHLRTGGTILPWQYYQAGFDVTQDWSEVRLPLTAFNRSGRLLRAVPRAEGLSSVAVVAYGRDHEAQVDVREIGFY